MSFNPDGLRMFMGASEDQQVAVLEAMTDPAERQALLDAINEFNNKTDMDVGVGKTKPMSEMTPERKLIEKLGFQYPEIERSKYYQPGRIEDTVKYGAMEGGSRNLEQTANPLLQGIAPIARGFHAGRRGIDEGVDYLRNKLGMDTDADLQFSKAMHRADEAAYRSRPRLNWGPLGDPLETLGSGISTAPMPGGKVLPAKMLSKAGFGALATTGVASGLEAGLQPTLSGPDEDLLKEKAKQISLGMLLGPAAQLGVEKAVIPGVRSTVSGARKLFSGGPSKTNAGNLEKELLAKLGSKDASDVVQSDLQATLAADKKLKDDLYKKRDELAKDQEVDPVFTMEAIDRWVDRFENSDVVSKMPNENRTSLVKTLKKFRENLAPTKNVKTGLVDEYDNDIVKQVPNKIKFMNTAATVTDLSHELKKAFAGQGEYGGVETAAFQDIKTALRSDMNDAVDKSGNAALKEAHATAQAQGAKHAERWKGNTPLSKLTQSPTSDEIVDKMANMHTKRARIYYDAMSPEGRDAVKYSILNKIERAAQSTDYPGELDPKAWLKAAKTYDKSLKVFMQGDDLARFEGLKKLIDVSHTTSKVAGGATGVALTSPALLAGSVPGIGDYVPMASMMGGAFMGRQWITPRIFPHVLKAAKTDVVQKLLLDANNLPPNSPKLLELSRQLYKMTGIEAGQQAGEREEQIRQMVPTAQDKLKSMLTGSKK